MMHVERLAVTLPHPVPEIGVTIKLVLAELRVAVPSMAVLANLFTLS